MKQCILVCLGFFFLEGGVPSSLECKTANAGINY